MTISHLMGKKSDPGEPFPRPRLGIFRAYSSRMQSQVPATLKDQMLTWSDPAVDVLVVATSGRFTADAVTWIEKHNHQRGTAKLLIEIKTRVFAHNSIWAALRASKAQQRRIYAAGTEIIQ